MLRVSVGKFFPVLLLTSESVAVASRGWLWQHISMFMSKLTFCIEIWDNIVRVGPREPRRGCLSSWPWPTCNFWLVAFDNNIRNVYGAQIHPPCYQSKTSGKAWKTTLLLVAIMMWTLSVWKMYFSYLFYSLCTYIYFDFISYTYFNLFCYLFRFHLLKFILFCYSIICSDLMFLYQRF